MQIRRLFAPREIHSADLRLGRVEPQYHKVAVRLLAAHAMAEKLTALGYDRAANFADDPPLRGILRANCAQEMKHARMLFLALAEIDVSEKQAERMMVSVLKSPSFEAPRCFADRAITQIDLAMSMLSLDMTGLLIIGVNYRESSYGPHSRAAELILDEEADHEAFASEFLGLMVERHGIETIDAALREWLPRAVNFFGPPDSGFTYDCLRYGLKAYDNHDLADLYLTRLERRTCQLGLTLPRLTPSYPHALA